MSITLLLLVIQSMAIDLPLEFIDADDPETSTQLQETIALIATNQTLFASNGTVHTEFPFDDC